MLTRVRTGAWIERQIDADKRKSAWRNTLAELKLKAIIKCCDSPNSDPIVTTCALTNTARKLRNSFCHYGVAPLPMQCSQPMQCVNDPRAVGAKVAHRDDQSAIVEAFCFGVALLALVQSR